MGNITANVSIPTSRPEGACDDHGRAVFAVWREFDRERGVLCGECDDWERDVDGLRDVEV